jgi:maltose O-acetyltransferase
MGGMGELTDRDNMTMGRSYDSQGPMLVAARVEARRLARAFTALDPGDAEAQRVLLSWLLTRRGERVTVEAPFHADHGWIVGPGDDVSGSAFAVLLDCAPIVNGAGSGIGPGVRLRQATHPVDPQERRRGAGHALPVTAGDGVWIGAGAHLGPGVTVYDDSVVAAGAVVVRDVSPRGVVAGVPATGVRVSG